MSQQCGMKPSHGPLQGPMLVSHYDLLNISLAEMHKVIQCARSHHGRNARDHITAGMRAFTSRQATRCRSDEIHATKREGKNDLHPRGHA